MRASWCLLVLLVSTCGQLALAQDPAMGQVELQDLMKQIYLAYGGKENLAKLDNNYVLIGDQIQPASADAEAPPPVHFRMARKGATLRMDIEPGGDAPPISTVYDAVSAWKAINKVVEDLPDGQAKILKGERDHEPAVLVHFGEPGYNFKLLGRTSYKATPVYAVELMRDTGDTETIFVDEKNYLVVAITYKGKDSESNTNELTTEFSQYRPAAGTIFPFKQTQYNGDKATLILNISSVDTSQDIDASQFRRPDRPDEIRLGKSISVPFEYAHKEILVKVRLNNSEPLDFLLDTAASQTVVDRRTAAENYLDKQGSFPVTTAGGVVPTQMTEIKKLTIGDIELGDTQAVMLDLMPQTRQMGKRVAGIIGANILKRFAVTVDFAKSQVIFNDANSYKPPVGATVVPFAPKQGPTVRAFLNGTSETIFLVDTGAAFNNLPSRIAKNFLGGQTPHLTEGTGLDGRPVKLATLVMPSVKIGTQVVKSVTFTYSVEQDAQVQTKGFVESSNVGVLGNPFWQNFMVTFDYKFQRIVLQPNTVQTSRRDVDQLISTGDSKLVIYRDLRASEAAYEKALLRVQALNDAKLQARVWGRIGNLRRVMAKDLNRPEQARIAYEYFSKAQELAHKLQDREAEGRILADWSLLYLDNGQVSAAQQALQGATLFSPQDPQVNINFAVYLYKMQRYPEMQKYIEKALFLDPSSWQALWYKVKLAELFNDPIQMKDTLKDILKYYPWSKLAKDKLTALTAPVIPPAVQNHPTGTTGSPNVQQIVPSR